MAIIPVAPPSHLIENPLLYTEKPYLCVIETLHRFYDRHQNKCITLAANVSDEELRINKGITICFAHVADVTEIHHSKKLTETIH